MQAFTFGQSKARITDPNDKNNKVTFKDVAGSKEAKEELKEIVEPFKEDDGVCDIDMWYDEEDDMYSVYLVFGTEELNDKFTRNGKFVYVRKKQKEVKETIKSYLPIDNLYHY